MIDFSRARLVGLLRRARLPGWVGDGLMTLSGVYLIQLVFCKLVLGAMPPHILVRPFSFLPAWVFIAWDSAYYRGMFHVYDRYSFPPLYPLTLRAVAFVFGFDEHAFEKSAVVLNFFSHAVIVLGLTYYLRTSTSFRGIQAWVVACLIFFFPGHNTFFAAYSESLFLALTVLAFCLHAKGWIGSASIAAGFSVLARTMGSFLALAFVIEQLFYCVRDGKLYWRKLLLSGWGLLFVVGWHLFLRWRGTTAFREAAPWIDSLVEGSVPAGHSAYVWVLKYLALNGRWMEVLPFWAAVAAMGYCLAKRRLLEFLYIAIFYVSLAFYIYRPFPWSRYVSVLFPVQIMAADFLKDKPRLTAVLLVVTLITCYHIHIELFEARIGEP